MTKVKKFRPWDEKIKQTIIQEKLFRQYNIYTQIKSCAWLLNQEYFRNEYFSLPVEQLRSESLPFIPELNLKNSSDFNSMCVSLQGLNESLWESVVRKMCFNCLWMKIFHQFILYRMRNKVISSLPPSSNSYFPPYCVLEIDFPLYVHFLWVMFSLTRATVHSFWKFADCWPIHNSNPEVHFYVKNGSSPMSLKVVLDFCQKFFNRGRWEQWHHLLKTARIKCLLVWNYKVVTVIPKAQTLPCMI